MPANQRPVFALLPKTPVVNLSTANTTNAVVASPTDAADFRELYTCAIPEGAKVTNISIQYIGTGTPSAALFNIWLTNSSGANARVIRMITVPAGGTISTTVPGSFISTTFLDFQVQNGQKIFVSLTTLAANTTLNVYASIGEFA
jgi:hypothetical protein